MDEVRQLLGAHPDPPRRGPLLRALRRAVREFTWVLIVIMDLGRRFGALLLRTEYRLAGGCKKRGACCHHVLLEWSPWFERWPILGRLALFKYTRIHSFFDRGYSWEIEDGFIGRVMGCHALQEDGSCGEYRLRPVVCRAFPELPLTGKPLLLKGCGYSFERRDGRPDRELVQIGSPRRLQP